MATEKILVVDDETSMTQYLSIALRKAGYEVTAVNSGQDALEKAKTETFSVAITDFKMPGMDGIEVLAGLKKIDPSLPVILMTAYASQQVGHRRSEPRRLPVPGKEGQERRDQARGQERPRDAESPDTRTLYLKRQLKRSHSEKEIIGTSEEMMRVFKMVDKVADTDSTILIFGESGTGKELIAREIHYRSNRAQGPFVSSTAAPSRGICWSRISSAT